jgi:sulfhydrogenase subunit beta (sulfur reductase)
MPSATEQSSRCTVPLLLQKAIMNLLSVSGLDALLDLLATRGYRLVGPTRRDGAIVIDAIDGLRDLPKGAGDDHDPARYALTGRADDAYFGFTVSPTAWKRFFIPPKFTLWSATRSGKTFTTAGPDEGHHPPLALIGVRPCDLHAMQLQDGVYLREGSEDLRYARIRKEAFVVVVQCTAVGDTCFCGSMGTGPFADEGYDLALTELIRDGRHVFLCRSGSDRGRALLAEVPLEESSEEDIVFERELRSRAGSAFVRTINTEAVREALKANVESPLWDDIAKRCLTCANCTMVCPTCFCFTIEDVTDLTGTYAERRRRWDSCYTAEFTKVAGGNIRPSPRSRYRQWLTHKFTYWYDQFGSAGCVGCGRCITWCPVGIDITVEASRFPIEHTPA